MHGLIDTHAHIYLSKFNEDLDHILENARSARIQRIYMPNIDSSTIERMMWLENKYRDFCFAMMGIHPCYINDDFEEELSIAYSWLKKRDFCAIGEIGIDLYWDKTHKQEQIKAFEQQINWAKELGKPIVIHCRDSIDLTIEIVKKHQDGTLKGIFHCFTGNTDQALQITNLDFLLGIGGVATFKNGGLDKVLPSISLDQMVLETDSPYLAPVPFRGKRNEPAYLSYISERVAEIMDIDVDELVSRSTINALRLFENG